MTPGVDLSDPASRSLIERLYWSRFAGKVRAAGRDPEDCLQQVFLGLLARNQGIRPFDPAVSSLSNYGYIVCRSVVANYLDHHRRADRRLGVPGEEEDAATWNRAVSPAEPMEVEARLVLRGVAEGLPLVVAVLRSGIPWWQAREVAEDLREELETPRKKPSRKKRRGATRKRLRAVRKSRPRRRAPRYSDEEIARLMGIWGLERAVC